MCRKWNKILNATQMDFSFMHMVVYICLTYIMNRKNSQRLISCKNKEKFPLENLVSANMKLFGRIYAVTETDGNTEKQVKLPDRIFTFPPVERTK